MRPWRAPESLKSDMGGARATLTERIEREPHEHDPSEHDPSEYDGSDRDPPERDRESDRERESASLPVLLRTLGAVAADVAALAGPEPAALPTLRELLASVADPPPAAAPRSGGLRARLAGTATAAVMTLAPPPPPGPRGRLGIRRATGPPRR